eukprot:13769826-Ditylum_brightwellii.AAC.1
MMVENDVSKGRSLVILELGCGVKVPAVRNESNEVLRDSLERARSSQTTDQKGCVTLVRVNPKNAEPDNEELDLA